MALFQPSLIVPDVRSGIGQGTVDATQDLTVSWHINGPSALTAFQIVIYTNDAASTQKFTTGKITSGCPAYGTSSTGEIQFFSYTISAASLSSAAITNGNEYKLIITQWWNANDSVVQSSASAFITRATPSVSVQITPSQDGQTYVFTGTYQQSDGDTLNWFRWRIKKDTGNTIIYDSGYITGTMNMSLEYSGFLNNEWYDIQLFIQTENGVEASYQWPFYVTYQIPSGGGEFTAVCAENSDAVMLKYDFLYFPGRTEGTTDYEINETISGRSELTLNSGRIYWLGHNNTSIRFASPWCVLWSGTLMNESTRLIHFTYTNPISGMFADLDVYYDSESESIILRQYAIQLASQSGISGDANITIALTADTFYIRANSVYYEIPITYEQTNTQPTIEGVSIDGPQKCSYIEVLDGTYSGLNSILTNAIQNGTYYPTSGRKSYEWFCVRWKNGINASSIDYLNGFVIYRTSVGQSNRDKLCQTAFGGFDVFPNRFPNIFDYSARSQNAAYTYTLYPLDGQTYLTGAVSSNAISPCWWNWTLMECQATTNKNIFQVLAAYRFRNNVETGGMSNNNTPNVLQNFTPYPTVQIAPHNYKTGTLTALIGAVDWSSGQPQYKDTIELRDAIMALSASQNPLFLKNRKGDLFRVRISSPIGMQTADATVEQMQTATIQWVEVGSTDGVCLYATSDVGVTVE